MNSSVVLPVKLSNDKLSLGNILTLPCTLLQFISYFFSLFFSGALFSTFRGISRNRLTKYHTETSFGNSHKKSYFWEQILTKTVSTIKLQTFDSLIGHFRSLGLKSHKIIENGGPGRFSLRRFLMPHRKILLWKIL